MLIVLAYRISAGPCLWQHWASYPYHLMNLVNARDNFTEALLFYFLVTNEIQCICICTVSIWMSSLVNAFFKTLKTLYILKAVLDYLQQDRKNSQEELKSSRCFGAQFKFLLGGWEDGSVGKAQYCRSMETWERIPEVQCITECASVNPACLIRCTVETEESHRLTSMLYKPTNNLS